MNRILWALLLLCSAAALGCGESKTTLGEVTPEIQEQMKKQDADVEAAEKAEAAKAAPQ